MIQNIWRIRTNKLLLRIVFVFHIVAWQIDGQKGSGWSRAVDTGGFDQTVIRQSTSHAYRATYVPRRGNMSAANKRTGHTRIPFYARNISRTLGIPLLKTVSLRRNTVELSIKPMSAIAIKSWIIHC